MSTNIEAAAVASISKATRAFLAAPRKMLIGGEWVDAISGKMLSTFDPSNGDAITSVPAAAAADIDVAVQAARRAFDSDEWRNLRPVDRELLLLRLADEVEAHGDEFAELECLDNGKSLVLARRVDIKNTVEFLRYIAGWATKIEGSTIDVSLPRARDGEYFAYTRKEPIGVVGAIIPWNFPLMMAAWKIGPALATGCTVVLKPAEETPLTALRLGELLEKVGYPKGVVNIVTGTGIDAGAPLAAHPGIDKIAFTGSTEVGKLVGRAAMDNMTRTSLELGGKSPVIVLEDANPRAVIGGAASAIFFNQGQACTAGSRLYVHKKLFDQVIGGIAEKAAKMKLGSGLDPATQIAPLISERQRDRVWSYIEAGKAQGAQAVAGAARPDNSGYFVEPTVFVDADQKMRIVQEEIFGPVLVAIPFEDLNEVTEMANDSPYGLGASIWSHDLNKIHRLIPKIKAGTVWVNCHNMIDPALPFGGFKHSGIGREMGRAVIDMYTETKSVCMAI
ncbi:aldehyde dehydrogenase family protein [Nitratireductor alexandrii]|uniref:aldehyde dehydrogenase family protein n=1 Tax=Nitratireductor alexandrii TaxID=2448161 RepID=UPI000FDA55D3|nr:aldehyde dehydrogenase family protein [Nitratireductor alexandrii]